MTDKPEEEVPLTWWQLFLMATHTDLMEDHHRLQNEQRERFLNDIDTKGQTLQ